ncbi:MAG: coiled-coil domain-containing protein [Thermodesulfobacteriota bacterium]
MRNTDSVIDLYDSLLTAQDDRARARIIAAAFERLEDRYPEIKDMATASGVRETELRLQKEIEQIRADLSKEIAQVRADLSKEIEQTRADLRKEIEQVRLRIEEVRTELGQDIAKSKHDILRWTVGLLFAQLITILAALIGLNFM